MSLLAQLIERLPTTAVEKPSATAQLAPLVTVAPIAAAVNRPYANAANATDQWRHARDQFINHVMTCRGCYAPGGRYCASGTALRAAYDSSPM